MATFYATVANGVTTVNTIGNKVLLLKAVITG